MLMLIDWMLPTQASFCGVHRRMFLEALIPPSRTVSSEKENALERREAHMLGKILKASVLGIILILLSSAVMARPMEEKVAETSRKGPRTEELVVKYYNNVTEAYAALKADEIDILDHYLTRELYEDAVSDPNILLAGYASTGFYRFDINNNYTIHTYPGVESPMWFREVRRAVAWCTDKDYIVDVFCEGFAERVDAPLSAPAKGWANESYIYPNYPYEYDPARASAELDTAGWVQGSTPNPKYDPGFPGSTECLRTYPPGHSKSGLNVDPLMWYIRTDYPPACSEGGHMVADAMEKIGFKITRIEGDSQTVGPKVMIEKDYHFISAILWGSGLYPLYLYTIYHSQFWNAPSHNWVTGNNASNLPNYPEYDRLVEGVVNPTSPEDLVRATKLATGFWVDQCINIPLYSHKSYRAYSSKVLGLVNAEGSGIYNSYSDMNCYKADGSPIRRGFGANPYSMNPYTTYPPFPAWFHFEQIYNYAGSSWSPYNPAAPQPQLLQDWELGSWNDGGVNKTYVTHWVRNDSYFCEAVTGNRLANVNASDYFFSVWYTHANKDTWLYGYVSTVHHIEIHDDYSWTVYFNDSDYGYWHYLDSSPMVFPVDLWLREPLANRTIDTFPAWTGTGAVPLTAPSDPVWINQVTVDGTPLTLGVDYNLFGYGDNEPCTLNVTTPQGGTLTVDYWAYGDSQGFTPGNLSWDTILTGSGMYYMTSFTPGVGGGATFKRNPYYWMETPPLGEVDFVWKWIDGPKPRSGYNKIDIYDIVMAIGEYGGDGTGVPDSATEHRRWFPGADLAPPGGKINIYDVVTMVGQYGQTFAAP